jgi:hypothetical protein
MGRWSVMSRVSTALLGAVVGAAVLAQVAFADATPVQFLLQYLPNVSNSGTTSASGIAELVMLEGEVRISATGLPHLDNDQQYVGWVVNTETNQFQRVGAFNSVEGTATVHYENVLADAIPDNRWNLLLVTIEASATPNKPSNKHSIAGLFPRTEREAPPAVLPNTGGPDEPSAVSYQPSGQTGANWLSNLGLAALTLCVGAGTGYVVGKKRSRAIR